MAAGDVVIDFDSGRDVRGVRLVAGRVTLDGANPTPVELATFMRTCLGGVVSVEAAAPLALDPSVVVCSPSGSQLLVEAYKFTSATDPTLIDSTDNAAEVTFVAWGTP